MEKIYTISSYSQLNVVPTDVTTIVFDKLAESNDSPAIWQSITTNLLSCHKIIFTNCVVDHYSPPPVENVIYRDCCMQRLEEKYVSTFPIKNVTFDNCKGDGYLQNFIGMLSIVIHNCPDYKICQKVFSNANMLRSLKLLDISEQNDLTFDILYKISQLQKQGCVVKYNSENYQFELQQLSYMLELQENSTQLMLKYPIIHCYSRYYDVQVNIGLRSGLITCVGSWLLEQLFTAMQDPLCTIEHDDIILYRGVRNMQNKLQVGEEWNDTAFMSTSFDREMATKFTKNDGQLLILHIPHVFTGIPLLQNSKFKEEYEIILPPSKWLIEKEDNGVYHLTHISILPFIFPIINYNWDCDALDNFAMYKSIGLAISTSMLTNKKDIVKTPPDTKPYYANLQEGILLDEPSFPELLAIKELAPTLPQIIRDTLCEELSYKYQDDPIIDILFI